MNIKNAFPLLLGISAMAVTSYANPNKKRVFLPKPHTLSATVFADVKGTVNDRSNKPLAGVAVKVGATGTPVITGADGTFTVSASIGDTLFINAVGFKNYQALVTGASELNIKLDSEGNTFSLDGTRPVELIYTTRPANLTAASNDVVYSNDIIKTPVTSFRNTLTGRLAGLYTLQSSGLPGSDGASLTLRGQPPIIIIDGVVAGLTQFDLEEIESITVLKDAVATAMLGVRASNGAILVTTKKGKEGKQQISFTAQTAVQQPLGYPKTLNAYDYARLRNEALRNEGIDSSFSGLYYPQAALQAYQNHSDPVNYPDENYRDAVTRKSSLFSRYTLSATGGNRFARYFASIEHINQSGIFRTVDSNSYNTNNNLKSYIVRSNVDVSITPKLTGGIYLLGRILNANEPGASTGTIISNLLNTPANAYPLLNPNGSFGGSQIFQNNILAQTIGSGYRQRYNRDILVNLYLKRTFDEITPGLWIQAKAAYYATLQETISRNKSFAVYQQGSTAGSYITYGANGAQGNGNGIDNQGRTDYEELSVGYDRTFNKVHNFNALVLVNRDNSTTGDVLPYTISGTSGRASYAYKNKYVAEVVFGYNGSNRYPDNGATKRGFFPALGLSWNIEQENFLKDVSWITRLKLFGSYGKTGWDNPGYFVYYPRFFDGPGATFGTGASGVTTITEGTLPNRNITWEKAKKLNVGMNGAVLNNHLSFNVEYFRNKYYDVISVRGGDNPISMGGTTIGNDFPIENFAGTKYKGWEGQLTWQQTSKRIQYYVSANMSSVGSELTEIDEVPRQYDWMKRTGQPLNQQFGYIAEGLFQTQAEINTSATLAGYKAQPGDIKYRDLNGDGVINQFDQTAIGNTKPLFFYGASFGVTFAGFDLSALVQGVKNRNIYLSGNSYWAFQAVGTGQAYNHNLGRWTPATAATATYPRLSYGNNINNEASSSYWMHSGDYIRLKNFELGYSLPASVITRVKLQTVRIFANGYNLLTSASSDALDGRDPESFTGGYPLQRVINFGINIKF